jgi:sulfite reductase (NADPH) hemoprotein beta-component
MSETIDKSVLSAMEKLKQESNYLRCTLVESLADPVTGAIADGDTQLSKFHGIYQQHDRDLEKERKSQKLEPAFSFLIRVRLPGGIASREQWLQMDRLSDQYVNGTMKLTTRQTFQLHGVIKKNLKTTMQGINHVLLTTITACGDVNRNVMSLANPAESEVHAQAYWLAQKISDHLIPETTAYHEIWLDKKLLAGGEKDVEPIYGDHYLPRKFKIGVAVPPGNDIDVFSQDLGFIAIQEGGVLAGYNVTAGGGLDSTFLSDYGVWPLQLSGIRQNSIACAALNTCSQAFAEAERYLPALISKVESILNEYNLVEEEILAELRPLIADFATNREEGEHFGDFVIRKKYVEETLVGKLFKH